MSDDASLLGRLERLQRRVALRPPRPRTGAATFASLEALWQRCDGTEVGDLGIVLEGRAASADATRAIRRDRGFERAVAVAYDHGGNVALLVEAGDLAGIVVVWNHEEPVAAPAFASLLTFLDAVLANEANGDLVMLARELPRVSPAPPETLVRERALFDARRAAFLAGGDSVDAFVAIALAPMGDPNALEPFFERGDMWVREEACRALARIQPAIAVARLERAALEGPAANVPSTCLAELRRIGTPEALAALTRLRPHLPQYDERFFLAEPRRR